MFKCKSGQSKGIPVLLAVSHDWHGVSEQVRVNYPSKERGPLTWLTSEGLYSVTYWVLQGPYTFLHHSLPTIYLCKYLRTSFYGALHCVHFCLFIC